jgi:hypothetical protein
MNLSQHLIPMNKPPPSHLALRAAITRVFYLAALYQRFMGAAESLV